MTSRTVVFFVVSLCVAAWLLASGLVVQAAWRASTPPTTPWEFGAPIGVGLLLAGLVLMVVAALQRATQAEPSEPPAPHIELPQRIIISYTACRGCGFARKVVNGIVEDHDRHRRGARLPEKCPGAGQRVA